MRPLLQHASRSLIANAIPSSGTSSSRSLAGLAGWSSPTCLGCLSRAGSAAFPRIVSSQLNVFNPNRLCRQSFSSSAICREERKPLHPSEHNLTSPASTSRPLQRSEDIAPENLSSLERQERLQEEPDVLLESQTEAKTDSKSPENETEGRSAVDTQERHGRQSSNSPKKESTADNIARVPDEHLPSHRERQRWDLSKRFSEIMDELLPRLAVVTQKVNRYTGTDYSGVEALRREIKEQENLVKARRLAIDSAKQVLDTALAHQASSQKEVVALLERKHSWSAGDLERYMSLIRSEHINDQAVREAKEAVMNAENALEEARTQLEKRERAQYHEEQIWSDTIRRNSTWVTFGLMGVNIFLLLLSLAIIEPWRRRRMVREIKNALEAHKTAMEAGPASAAATAPIMSTAVQFDSVKPDLIAIEEEIDKVIDVEEPPNQNGSLATVEPAVEESPLAEKDDSTSNNSSQAAEVIPDSIRDPLTDTAVPGAAPLLPTEGNASPQQLVSIEDEVKASGGLRARFASWQRKITAIAQDVISERTISMRRIDYTTAILQGAAAGAVITAALISMWRPA